LKSFRSLSNGPAGFTLAELLIAIVIFSVVISLTYAAYNSTFKVISNAGASSKYGERARITLERFSRDLGSFYLGSSGELIGETNTFGQYRGDTLHFTSRAHLVFNKDEAPRGYALISYSVVEEEDSSRLRLFRADVPVLPGVAINEEEQGFLLSDGLREVSFTYIDQEGNESDTWSTQERQANGNGDAQLPAVVKLKIGFAAEDAEDDEDLIYFSTAVALPGAGKI